METRKWIDLRNVSDESADLYIYDTIRGPEEAVGPVAALRELKSREINVRINSPGGSIYGGLAVYNALRDAEQPVTVYIDGVAASMASVIAMAGDRIVMGKGSMMMIHAPSAAVAGKAEDMRETADVLDKLHENLAEIYRSRTGASAEKIADLMSRDSWLTADQCLALGLCTEIEASKTIEANSGAEHFTDLSPELAAILNAKPEIIMSKNNEAAAPAATASNETAAAVAPEVFTAEAVSAKVQSAVESTHAAAKTAIDAAKAEWIAATNAARAEFTNKLAAKDAEIVELKAALESAEANSASKLGVPPIASAAGNMADSQQGKPSKPVEILAHYRTLKGESRSDYFEAHKAEIWSAYDLEMAGR